MEERDGHRLEREAEIEREIREGRKFSGKEAFARMAGAGAMKGASPVSEVQQAETAIGTWLRGNVADPAGALHMLLQRNLKGSEALLNNLDRPLAALSVHIGKLLESDYLLSELVREVDVEWGRRMDERPYFERDDAPPDPADPYTADSVRKILAAALETIKRHGG